MMTTPGAPNCNVKMNTRLRYRAFILVVLLAVLLWLNLSFLKPLLMGAIFAIVLSPLMRLFDRASFTRRFGPGARAALITIGFTLLILIPVGLLLFAGAQAVVQKIQSLNIEDLTPEKLTFNGIAERLGLTNAMNHIYSWFPMTHEQVQGYLTKGLAAAGAYTAQVVQGFVFSLPGLALSDFILLLTIFFMLADGPEVANFFRENLIFNRGQTERLMNTTVLLCKSVIVATLISGAAQAAIISIMCLITGQASILLFAFLTFVFSFVPVLGTAPIVLFLSAHGFIQGDTTAGILWLATIALTSACDNFVRPFVMRGGAKLHPLIAFVAALGALDTIGFYGLFIGPIVAGIFFTLLPMVTESW